MSVKNFLQNKSLKRIIIFSLLVLVLYLMRSMINLILLTFILTYLMSRFQGVISRVVGAKVNPKGIIAALYILLVSGIAIALYKYLPVITIEITNLITQINTLYHHPPKTELAAYLFTMIDKMELASYIDQGLELVSKSVTNLSGFALQFMLSLILSLFFLLEKQCIITFTSKFKDSTLAAFYQEIAYFGKKFSRSFGKVIETQFIIAVVNGILTTICLYFLGFPQLIGLGMMIFFLGLIPVAGAIISLVPLCAIGYNIGGFTYIVYVLILIAVIHALESYVLNPKLMSAKTNLPVFYTFIVLIFSEHFFGIWGLIIGIPVFMFLLDVLEVLPEETMVQ